MVGSGSGKELTSGLGVQGGLSAAEQKNFQQSPWNQGIASMMGAAQQGVSLPYPYSAGYLTPSMQSSIGADGFRVPFRYASPNAEEPVKEVAPIPGPMDVILNNRPRKMRIEK